MHAQATKFVVICYIAMENYYTGFQTQICLTSKACALSYTWLNVLWKVLKVLMEMTDFLSFKKYKSNGLSFYDKCLSPKETSKKVGTIELYKPKSHLYLDDN